MTFELALAPVLAALIGSIRVLAMMAVGPLFSHPALGVRFRIMAALMVAWIAAPVAVGPLSESHWDAASVAAAALVELAIGLAVGVGSALVFAAIMQLGEFLAVQGGIGAAQTLDPATGISSPAVGLALQSFALLVFLVIDGHHDLLRGIAASFEFLPVGGALPSGDVFMEIARLGGAVWSISVQIAAPVTVAIFVQNVATGVLGRALPQLNILIVNLPLHVGIVLLILGLGASDLIHAMKDELEIWPDTVFEIVAGGRDGG
ncbi:flagellar biosynthetic protein FliR [Myxococcota bacterium]|nr:flagellar biosynthetic protein FliR [Myxococcota bacterium]